MTCVLSPGFYQFLSQWVLRKSTTTSIKRKENWRFLLVSWVFKLRNSKITDGGGLDRR